MDSVANYRDRCTRLLRIEGYNDVFVNQYLYINVLSSRELRNILRVYNSTVNIFYTLLLQQLLDQYSGYPACNGNEQADLFSFFFFTYVCVYYRIKIFFVVSLHS